MKEEAEGVRLAYVASTRARDLLVVPALGDEPWEGGWFSPLNGALYPPIEDRRTAAHAPGCPSFKSKDSVLERPNQETATNFTVCPGFHEFAAGYSVAWWEPGQGGGLDLGRSASFGVRRDDLIVKDVARDVVAGGRTRYDAWRLARADARAAGAEPSVSLMTVREWTADLARPNPAGIDPALVRIVDLSQAAGEDGATGGTVYGLLVHSLLAHAPFDALPHDLEGLAAAEARLLGLDEQTASRAARAVERAFAHDVVRRARAAAERGQCRRESPISWTLADNTTIEGVVDLAFEEAARWHVVDFKTDRELDAEGEERYRRQVSIYAAAIARATNAPVDAMLIRL